MVAFWTIFWVKDVAKENLKNSIELLVQYGELTKNIQKAVGLNFAELARDQYPNNFYSKLNYLRQILFLQIR